MNNSIFRTSFISFKLNTILLLACLGLLVLPAAQASGKSGFADRIAFDVGTSAKGLHIARALLQWDWRKREDSPCGCDLSFIEFDASYWTAKESPVGSSDYLTEVGIKPVFRLQRAQLVSWFPAKPFLEGAVGIHYLTNKSVPNSEFYTSTKFQFGEHFAWGFLFGKKEQIEISQRFLHYSNGAIRKPNPGVNYKIVHIGYHF